MSKSISFKTLNMNKINLPIVYSCSGCSDVAQLANQLAVRLHKDNLAEMSCIAGVGGNVKALTRVAKSNRKIIAIDGCGLNCCKACLSKIDVTPDIHILLNNHGFKKNTNKPYDSELTEQLWNEIVSMINR